MYTNLYVAAPTIWNILPSTIITKLNCHLKHTFNTLPAYNFYYIDRFHQTATILQRYHTRPRIYHVNSTFTKLLPFYNVTHCHKSTTSMPLSPNCHHHATLSCTATNLPCQFHFHQTATILQRQNGHESTTSIPLSPNCHHFTTSYMATNLPRQYHFHQTATILQRHTWPRIYHVNTTFTKLPPFYNVIRGHESTTSIPLSPNCHHFTTSYMATNLPRQCHFHQTAIILQRHTWPRIYHINTTFTKLPPHGHVTMPRHCHFHVTATFFQRGNHVAC